jgi:uncharacterized protein (TIGR02265 family)
MSSSVVVKGVVAQSTFDYVKDAHGIDVWQRCLDRLTDADRIVIKAGGNVPLDVMGRFHEAFLAEACRGSQQCAQDEIRKMGAKSAEKLLQGGGIFSLFARFVTPKQVFARAEQVIRTAYPGVDVQVVLDSDEGGGTIKMRGMSGYPYGSQRIVGWLLRGLEIVGARNAQVSERNYIAGRIDSDEYDFVLRWKA